MATAYAFNGLIARPASFGLTGDLSSVPVSIPKGASTLTIHAPILDNGITYKVEHVIPPKESGATPAWVTAKWVEDAGNTGAPIINALTGFGATSAQTVTLSYLHIGVGVIRLTLSAANATALDFTLIFGLGD